MGTLRTKEMAETYKAYQASGGLKEGCVLCDAPAIKTFTYWKITKNKFPYDRIASTHDMILPLRHAIEEELTTEELRELKHIKDTYLNEQYQFTIEAMNKMKSVPAHFHLHLLVVKD